MEPSKSISNQAAQSYHQEAFAVLDMIVAQVEEAESRQETLKEIGKGSTERFFTEGYLPNSWHSPKGPFFPFPKAPSLGDTHQGAV